MSTVVSAGRVEQVGRLDVEALRRWLSAIIGPVPTLEVARIAGGNSNETLLLIAGGRRFVARRPPYRPLAPSAHSMEREHRLLSALAQSAVRAPRPIGLCTDPAVADAALLVMEYVADAVALTDTLPAAYAGGAITAVGEEMVDALAELHNADWRALGLRDFGKPDGFLERQVPRWSAQHRRYACRPLPLADEVAAWLEAHRPPAQEPSLIHGDFHLDNALFSVHGPRLLAFVDWEMATVGDPLLDVGLCLGFWGPRSIEPCAMPRVQAVSRVPQAPAREALARRYATRTGRSVDDLPYYMCLAFWKLALIVEGAYAQYVSGALRSDYAAALEDDVPRLLEEAASFAGISR